MVRYVIFLKNGGEVEWKGVNEGGEYMTVQISEWMG